MLFVICLLLTLVSSALANCPWSNGDPYLPTPTFDRRKIVGNGQLYEISRLPNPLDSNTVCSSIELCLFKNGTVKLQVTALNTETKSEEKWTSLLTIREGTSGDFVILDPPSPPKVKYTFAWPDTDYDHFVSGIVITETCDQSSLPYAWIASRERTLEPKYYKRAVESLRKYNMPVEQLSFVKQDHCETPKKSLDCSDEW